MTGRLFATEDNFNVAQVPLETRGAWAQGRPGAKEGEEGLATASARFSWAKQGRVNSEDRLVSITPAGFGPGLCPGDLGLGSRLACKSAKGRVVACVEVGSPTGCSLSGQAPEMWKRHEMQRTESVVTTRSRTQTRLYALHSAHTASHADAFPSYEVPAPGTRTDPRAFTDTCLPLPRPPGLPSALGGRMSPPTPRPSWCA